MASTVKTMPTVRTLVPWFGSNRTLAENVGRALDGCRWIGIPFAGGMSELVYLDAPTIVVNDLHRHVINLARVLADPVLGPRLYRHLRRVAFHNDELMSEQNGAKLAMEIDADDRPRFFSARAYFISQWMGRSCKSGGTEEFNGRLPVRWNANGGDSNRRYRSAVASIPAWRRILKKCNFTCLDCFEFLAKCQDVARHGIYCDPPFPDVGAEYRHRFTEADHERLADVLSRFQHARVVCRFYDHPLIRRLYPTDRWEWHEFTGRNQANQSKPERLICRNVESIFGSPNP